ncbi:mechanosensitive ion channel family protein [Maricaulis sp. CAU 1757]
MTTPDLDIDELLNEAAIQSRAEAVLAWLRAETVSADFWVQITAIAIALVVAFATKKQVTDGFAHVFNLGPLQRFKAAAIRFIAPIAGPLSGWILLSAVLYALEATEMETFLVRTASSLFALWVVIRLVSALINDPFWARTAATLAWIIAALNILGWLDPASQFLDGFGFTIGETDDGGERRVSVLTILRAAIVVAIFYWVAAFISRVLSTRVQRLPSLNPSAQILITKAIQVALMAAAGLLALTAVGIDLSALAIFGGAIGLGIGFGLQKIFSNLVSGVILLLDRSIKPGDVISVDETFGRVSTLGMRFASVKTRDGHEHLIPNEYFITEKVINWSFSEPTVRVKRTIGISYGSDVNKARELAIEAAEGVARVVSTPKPICHLMEFGDNSVNLELRFWIRDPEAGVNNVTSEVLLAVWDSYHEHGIEFPFPQRDVHLVGGEPLRVQILPADAPSSSSGKHDQREQD